MLVLRVLLFNLLILHLEEIKVDREQGSNLSLIMHLVIQFRIRTGFLNPDSEFGPPSVRQNNQTLR